MYYNILCFVFKECAMIAARTPETCTPTHRHTSKVVTSTNATVALCPTTLVEIINPSILVVVVAVRIYFIIHINVILFMFVIAE